MSQRASVLVLLAALLAPFVAACGGGSSDGTQPRTPNPNIPREGLGAGGDIGSPAPREMGGKGRGVESPKGKQ